jgi:hypothetical protein
MMGMTKSVIVGLALAVGLIASTTVATSRERLSEFARAIALQQVPKRFQGVWVDQHPDGGRMKVGATIVDFSSFQKKISSIEPADEDGKTVRVKYERVPPALQMEQVWRLTKVNGRETLIKVDAQEPTTISVYQRPR